jgi:hypothetical protein
MRMPWVFYSDLSRDVISNDAISNDAISNMVKIPFYFFIKVELYEEKMIR